MEGILLSQLYYVKNMNLHHLCKFFFTKSDHLHYCYFSVALLLPETIVMTDLILIAQ